MASDTATDEDGPASRANLAVLEKAFPFQGYIEKTEHRAITVPQLRRIVEYSTERCAGWKHSRGPETGQPLSMDVLNLYHLNEWAIMPSTKRDNCAFVELLAGEAQPPTWFTSHWWGECIVDFVRCLGRHAEVRDLGPKTAYWVCAYANRQHNLGAEISSDLTQTSFYQALLLSAGILLVLDEETPNSGPATPFTRIWCVFEQYTSVVTRTGKMLLDIAASSGGKAELLTDGLAGKEQGSCIGSYQKTQREKSFPLEIVRHALSLRVVEAQASQPEDRKSILNYIAGMPQSGDPVSVHPHYQQLQKELRAAFAVAVWPQAVEKNLVKELDLPSVLAGDTYRTSFTLDLASCECVDDADLAALGSGLPTSLQDFHLDVGNCPRVGDIGVTALAGGFSNRLETLWLRFYDCADVGDAAGQGLGRGLPSSLRELTVNFNSCKKLGDSGIASLGGKLPKGLQKLVLYCSGCVEVSDAGLAALGASLPSSLQHLELSFVGSQLIGDGGVACLAAGLARKLQHLELHFLGCEQVSDAGIAALRISLPASVQTAVLRFYGTAVSEETLDFLGDLDALRGWNPKAAEAAKPYVAPKQARGHHQGGHGASASSRKARASVADQGLQKVRKDLEDKTKRDKAHNGQIQTLLAVFRHYDKDQDGTIEKDELAAVLKRLNRRFRKKDIDQIFAAADSDKDGKISYMEFVAWLCGS